MGVSGQPDVREEPMTPIKSFTISKHAVWEAYRRVKTNKGAASANANVPASIEFRVSVTGDVTAVVD